MYSNHCTCNRVLRSGGLLFELKTARGQWLRNSATSSHFFLGFKPLAEALLGPLTPEASDLPPVAAAEPPTPTTPLPPEQPADLAGPSLAAEEAATGAQASSNGAVESAAAEAVPVAQQAAESRASQGSSSAVSQSGTRSRWAWQHGSPYASPDSMPRNTY